jgi:hypothetical protein
MADPAPIPLNNMPIPAQGAPHVDGGTLENVTCYIATLTPYHSPERFRERGVEDVSE